ncbi:MAG: Ig-like domain-containing protein, partial [Actinomycetota bacterium]
PANGSTITTTHAVTVSGVADGAVTVRVIESSTTIGTVVSNSDGNWAVMLSFANGVHTLTATATDLANNTGPSSVPVTFTVNVPPLPPPPAAPVITDPPEGSLQRPDVIVRGTGTPGMYVTILEGTSSRGTTTVQSDGSWSRLIIFSSGAHSLTATVTDGFGQTSPPSAPRSFTVDAQRPTVEFSPTQSPVLIPPLIPVVFQGSASDDIAVARVDLEFSDRRSGVVALDTTADACNGCPGAAITWQSAPVLPPGAYLVEAWAVDLAGNRSAPASMTVVVL